ncbi:MAG: hypothetical protein Q8O38_12520 [Sulfurimicrobium sp.]|nr:hypothetical protein [Sulfurimicrobium sp.]
MNQEGGNMREEDLHAYVDGQLDAARRAEVEDWLAANPDEQARMADLQKQNAMLHALFNPVLTEQDARGQRLTLYVRTDAREQRETAFRFAQEGKVGVFYWLDGQLGYALSGEMERRQLLRVAEVVYHGLNP